MSNVIGEAAVLIRPAGLQEFGNEIRSETEKLLREIEGQAGSAADTTVARLRQIRDEVEAGRENVGRLEGMLGSPAETQAQISFTETLTRGLNEEKAAMAALVQEAQQLAQAQLQASAAAQQHEEAQKRLTQELKGALGTGGFEDFQRELAKAESGPSNFGQRLLESVGRFRIRFNSELRGALQAANDFDVQAGRIFARQIGRDTVSLQGLSRGTSAAAPGLGAFAARLGVVGFAAAAAFDGVRQITDGIRATGDEAFTSGGKVRNFFAEFLSGRPVAGVLQFFDDRQAEIGNDIAAAMRALRTEQDPLIVTSEKLIDLQRQGEGALQNYIQILHEAGAVSLVEAANLLEVAKSFEAQEAAAIAAQQAIQGGGPRATTGPEFAKGGVPVRDGTPESLTGDVISPGVRAAIAREREEGDVQGLLEVLRVADRRITEKIAVALRERQGTKDEIAARVAQLREARKSINDEIARLLEPDTADRGDFIPAGIQAAIARERGEGDIPGLIDVLRAADRALARDLRDAVANKEGLSKAEVSALIAQIRGEKNAINDEIAELLKPPEQPAFRLPDRFAARQLAADATEALGDNLALAQDVENFLRNVLAKTKEGTDRYRQIQAQLQQAQAERIAVQNQIAANRAQAAQDEAARIQEILAIREATLSNALLRAQLTEGIEDNRRAIQDQINFFRSKEQQARELRDAAVKGSQAFRDQAQAVQDWQAKRLNAQAAMKNLTEGQRGFTLEEFFREAVDEFREFGSNIGPAGSVLAPQDARGAVAKIALERGAESHPGLVAQAIASDQAARDEEALEEARAQTAYLAILASYAGYAGTPGGGRGSGTTVTRRGDGSVIADARRNSRYGHGLGGV